MRGSHSVFSHAAGRSLGGSMLNETCSEAHFLHSLKDHRLETFQTRHLHTSLALIPYEGKGHPAGDGKWRWWEVEVMGGQGPDC